MLNQDLTDSTSLQTSHVGSATIRFYRKDWARMSVIKASLEEKTGRPQSWTDVVLYLLDRNDSLVTLVKAGLSQQEE